MANLECERVRLFPDGDELWIVIIQTLPYPNISIIPARYNEPEDDVNMVKCAFLLSIYYCAK